MVEDTTSYPYDSIAFLEMEFVSDRNLYSGSGFVVDQNDQKFLVTAAHCVRDDNNCPAKFVNAFLGMNGIKELGRKKKITFRGEDFTVPVTYKTSIDANDIALLDLQKLHQRKTELNEDLDWSLEDFPKSSFGIYPMRETHGAINEDFILCGNSLIDLKYNNSIISQYGFKDLIVKSIEYLLRLSWSSGRRTKRNTV